MDKETLKKLHNTHIEILNEFVRICKENNLIYFLFYGTLLGAVRHKGFIPWDDDLDVAMPRSDYEKFINIYEVVKNTKYYIVTNKCPVNTYYHYNQISKLCKKGTIFEETTRYEKDYCGIYIDIFPYDNCNLFFLPLQTFIIKYSLRLYRLKTYDIIPKNEKTNPKIKKIVKYIFPLWFCKILKTFSIKLLTIYNNKETKYITFFCGDYHYKNETHKIDSIFPLTLITFENNEYYSPFNTDRCLSRIYGNYMDIPPIEKQITHGNNVIFNTGDMK